MTQTLTGDGRCHQQTRPLHYLRAEEGILHEWRRLLDQCLLLSAARRRHHAARHLTWLGMGTRGDPALVEEALAMRCLHGEGKSRFLLGKSSKASRAKGEDIDTLGVE